MAKKKRIGRNAFVEDLLGAKEPKHERPKVIKPESAKVRIRTSKKPDRISKSYRLSRDLVKQVKIYAAEHDLRLSEVIEAALEEFLASHLEE